MQKHLDGIAELSAMMAAAPAESADPFAPPAMLNDPRFAVALTVWRDLVPKLSRANLYDGAFDRYLFATFCVYTAEWHEAALALASPGVKVRAVKNVHATDSIDRLSPWFKIREIAQNRILELAKRFGLTTVDRMNLMATQRNILSAGMPAGGHDLAQPREPDEGGRDMLSPIGALGGLDAPPPGPRSH